MKSKKLNFGCGKDYREGWINLDIKKDVKADIYADAEKGLGKIKKDTFELIVLRHVLEHIHREKFGFVLEELHRISKKDGIIKIWCPHFSCGITYRALDHFTPISYFTINESKLFLIKNRKFNFFRQSFPYKNKSSFINKITKILNPIMSFIPNSSPLFYERFLCWIFPVEEVYFELKVKK